MNDDERRLWLLQNQGYVVLRGILPRDEADKVLEQVVVAHDRYGDSARHEQAERRRGHRVGAAGVTNLQAPENFTQEWTQYLVHPHISALLDGVFGRVHGEAFHRVRGTR